MGSLVRLLQFKGGVAHLVEITLAEDSPANDTAIADLAFPRDAVVVAVVRADRLIVPRGDTTLQSGDEVLVLVTAEAEDAVHALFIAEQQAVDRNQSATPVTSLLTGTKRSRARPLIVTVAQGRRPGRPYH